MIDYHWFFTLFTAAVSRSSLHFRGTNHIAIIGSRLSIGKAGVYFKEQDKKKS